jgi:hypothetical protein
LARGARLLALLALLLAAAPARAAAAPPSADEIVARAQALGVGDQAQKLRSHFLPGVRLLHGGRDTRGSTTAFVTLDHDDQARFHFGDAPVLLLDIAPGALEARRYTALCGEFQDS